MACMQGSFGLNTVVSGTSQFVRCIMTGAQVKCALPGVFPVIILHSCNSELANGIMTLNTRCSCAEVNISSAGFSSFMGLNDYEAVDIIIDSVSKKISDNFIRVS